MLLGVEDHVRISDADPTTAVHVRLLASCSSSLPHLGIPPPVHLLAFGQLFAFSWLGFEYARITASKGRDSR